MSDSQPLESSPGKQAVFILGFVVILLVVVAAYLWLGWGIGGTDGVHNDRDPPSPDHSAASLDLSNLSVSQEQIFRGGPAKDGIPALTRPPMIPADEADYLRPADRVVGVVFEGRARAYPLRILNYHEVVNDDIGDTRIAVTYCPLCDSVAAFDRRTELGERDFGVSGLLYQSNVLLYDRGSEKESLWSQMRAAGISGAAADSPLTPLPVELATWQDWQNRYPATLVLSLNTGHERDYDLNPYEDYFSTPDLMFPVEVQSDLLHPKEPVLGVWTENEARAYAVSQFGEQPLQLKERLDGKHFTLLYEPRTRTARITESDQGVHHMYALWFAWYAFHPETELYTAP
jgi:hypothetical protein